MVRGSDGANALGERAVWHGEPQRQAAQYLPEELTPICRIRPSLSRRPRRATLTGRGFAEKWAAGLPPFPMAYDEGFKVGYKWYDAEKKPVLFPFGYGLSYTTYKYAELSATPGDK